MFGKKWIRVKILVNLFCISTLIVCELNQYVEILVDLLVWCVNSNQMVCELYRYVWEVRDKGLIRFLFMFQGSSAVDMASPIQSAAAGMS